MIALVDAYIIGRLQRLKRNKESITVYGPGAARPKGKRIIPCYEVSHYLDPVEDAEKSRRYLNDYQPSDNNATYPWPYGHNDTNELIEIDGPASWTVRKWPMPAKLFYQVDVLSTDETEASNLSLSLLLLFPGGYGAMIGDSWVRWWPEGHGSNLDAIEKPLFRRTHRFQVTGVWIDQPESWPSASINKIDWRIDLPPGP